MFPLLLGSVKPFYLRNLNVAGKVSDNLKLLPVSLMFLCRKMFLEKLLEAQKWVTESSKNKPNPELRKALSSFINLSSANDGIPGPGGENGCHHVAAKSQI